MVYATLSNSNRPGSPAVTVGFPITENVYADLESIGIGSATERDCYAGPMSIHWTQKVELFYAA